MAELKLADPELLEQLIQKAQHTIRRCGAKDRPAHERNELAVYWAQHFVDAATYAMQFQPDETEEQPDEGLEAMVEALNSSAKDGDLPQDNEA